MRVHRILCLAVAASALLCGCSFESHPERQGYAVDRSGAAPTNAAPPDAVVGEVIYDDTMELDDSGWFLADTDLGDLPLPRDATSSNGLLQEAGQHTLWVSPPGLYGAYPARVTSYRSEPEPPRRCEDVVEAPLSIGTSGSLAFGTFESAGQNFDLGGGDYRVRLCATGLDEALGEPEFDGDDLHVSASHFEFQIWPAPRRPGEIVKVVSTYAKEQHERVAGARRAATS